jgi:Ser-tRNA(Ala) deacylase AlaX
MGIRIAIQGNKPVPTGVYRVELVSVEHTETYCGEYLKWVFRIVDDGRTVVDYSNLSVSTSPTSKCVEWITALLNRELQPDEELDLETLVGRTAIAYVRLKKLQNRECNRIERLLPDNPLLYPQLTHG